jgi:hypothetical protein
MTEIVNEEKRPVGRPAGSKKGTGNYCAEWREVVAKAAEMDTSIENMLVLAGVTTNVQNWRNGFPNDGGLFMALMSERSCSADELVATGHKMPMCVDQLLKIRALKPANGDALKSVNDGNLKPATIEP